MSDGDLDESTLDFQISWRGSSLRPNRNEMVPLIHIQTKGGVERAHDLVGQLNAGFARSQRTTVVSDFRQDMATVAVRGAGQIHRQQSAPGRARPFRGGD